MKNKRILSIILMMTILILGSFRYIQHDSAVAASGWANFLGISYETEAEEGKYFQLLDKNQQVITSTALPVHVGDEFWAADNKHYRVTKVDKYTATCEYLDTEKIAWLEEWNDIPVASDISIQTKNNPNNVVGVYHTHASESYVPTDGTESNPGAGGILKVGDVFANKLEKGGLRAYHDKTSHDPQDAGAYQRSRRTAVRLLKNRPAVMFDVHRDAVPADVYQNEINGQQITKIKLVVGRQNQNKQANLEFAKTMKAAMDDMHPGLFEGIFLAKGNYNQDLGPRMMLIEVGSHENSREDAERGVALFAETVPKVLGVYQSKGEQPQGKQTAAPGRTGERSGSWTAIWWILGIIVVGGGLFLIISTGSVGGGVKKLKEFTGSEFKDVFKRKNK
ncbi:MAG: stage II sporulation protein P [Dehalobacterium sp.]|jgi:stage II sporulation protein P